MKSSMNEDTLLTVALTAFLLQLGKELMLREPSTFLPRGPDELPQWAAGIFLKKIPVLPGLALTQVCSEVAVNLLNISH